MDTLSVAYTIVVGYIILIAAAFNFPHLSNRHLARGSIRQLTNQFFEQTNQVRQLQAIDSNREQIP